MNLNYKYILVIGIVALAGCTLFKKSIDKPIVVLCNEQGLQVVIHNTATFVKYTQANSKEQIAAEFIESFKKEGAITPNITFSNDATSADFILNLKTITVTESSATEKIDDPKSSYNGKTMELNTVDCTADIEIVDVKNKGAKNVYCSNSKTRTEKITNNRDLGDLISGINKDHTTYRTKLLSDSICIQLCTDVGRRIWTPLTRKLSKAI